jgi:acyl-coenzyme A synthetase/AMP-(fatty) acid ligase
MIFRAPEPPVVIPEVALTPFLLEFALERAPGDKPAFIDGPSGRIAPAELEAVLLGHPAIADAAVVPRADEEAGQVPKAFVVLKSDVAPAHILEYVAARVAPYKRLRSVEVVDQIPKSPSGKILRRILAERQRGSG